MNACNPEVVAHRARPGCKVSVILLDWGVRESYHSLDYLNRQTVPRSDYELIWLEFYDRKPQGLRQAAAAVDKWIVAGYPEDHVFHKHRLYNLGILAAEGEICVICDSDAIFTPTFLEKVIAGLTEAPRTVLHLDEVRNNNRRLYPFCYPKIKDVLGKGCLNWHGTVTRGLDNSPDMLHEANYGACMAARRADLIALGGADEHPDYLGYVCGPYEMTFRLVNAGLSERWLRDEYLYHTWHPNTSGINTDYHGPHDGRSISLRALDSRAGGRVLPWVENPWIARARSGERLGLDEVVRLMTEKEEPAWRIEHPPTNWDEALWVESDYQGFNLFCHQGLWYGLKVSAGPFDPKRARRYHPLLEAESQYALRELIAYYNGLPTQLWARIRAQPLHRLPLRIYTRLTKELARLVQGIGMLVTCIAVCHNKPAITHEAIESVIEQSHPHWQLLVIDSGVLYDQGYYRTFNWENDERIRIIRSSETESDRNTRAMAPWCFNECFRREWVKGELIVYLCDDDLFYPNAFSTFVNYARDNPSALAMYASQDLGIIYPNGRRAVIGERRAHGVGGRCVRGRIMDGQVDYLQFCHHREVLEELGEDEWWPEGKSTEAHADGVFMEKVGAITPIFPIDVKVSRNRRTPQSTYVRSH